ncbi:MAG: hypothetical protein R2681_00310 [Pyrinomonadaceae bacterium]
MRRKLFILSAIIFAAVGLTSEIQAQTDKREIRNLSGSANRSEPTDRKVLLTVSKTGTVSGLKRSSIKPSKNARYFIEDKRDTGYSFELKLFLTVSAIMLLMTIFNAFGAKEELRECGEFD